MPFDWYVSRKHERLYGVAWKNFCSPSAVTVSQSVSVAAVRTSFGSNVSFFGGTRSSAWRSVFSGVFWAHAGTRTPAPIAAKSGSAQRRSRFTTSSLDHDRQLDPIAAGAVFPDDDPHLLRAG